MVKSVMLNEMSEKYRLPWRNDTQQRMANVGKYGALSPRPASFL